MEQTKALDALEPFLALTKAANSPRAAADLVMRATAHPSTYVFAELLSAPQIQALASSDEFAPCLKLLQIFSYGTYADYQSTPGLPDLNPAQALKLRQLSLLTLARDRANLAYPALQQALDLSTTDARPLEDLVISAVYAGLLDATLDPLRRAVQVNRVAPLRDLAPGAVAPMAAALRTWSDRCAEALADLDAQATAIREKATRRQAEQTVWEVKVQALLSEHKDRPAEREKFGSHGGDHQAGSSGDRKLAARLASQKAQRYNKRGPGLMEAEGNVDDEAMDVDEEEEDADGKKRASRRKL